MKLLRFMVAVLFTALPLLVVAADPTTTPEEIVKKVQEVYAHDCCFQARFDQLTVNVAMDLKDKFQGAMYVRKPGMIALDVEQPERQKVIIRGRNYMVFFFDDGTATHGEIPPEINLEHFFGFFANVGSLEKDFAVTFPVKSHDSAERLIFLELTDRKHPRSNYSLMLGIDMDRYTIRRAIIYDALGNYNRFDLSDIKFVSSLPESKFEMLPDPRQSAAPSK